MATREEAQFGTAKDLSNTYTSVGGPVPSNHKWVLHINVTNITATARTFRAYIADTSWSSGEPTGSTKVAAIVFDLPVAAGQTVQITGIVMVSTQELVVWSSGASLDVIASGSDVDVT